MRIDQLTPISQELTIRYPDGKFGWKDGSLTDIVLKVVSADSKQFHEVISQHAQAALGREDDLPIADRQRQTAEQIASCITGWQGLEDERGAVQYSRDKATELMQNPELAFVREQVESFVVRRQNFFRSGAQPAVRLRAELGAPEHSKQNGSQPPTKPVKHKEAAQEAGEAHQAAG
jgi:hypothetical protein